MDAQNDSPLTIALRSHRKGLARGFMPGRNIERFYDTMQVLAMAERLHETEIRILGLATEGRERGLQAARTGNLEEATTLIAKAREIYTLRESFEGSSLLRGDVPDSRRNRMYSTSTETTLLRPCPWPLR